MHKVNQWLSDNRWVWSAVGVIILWVVLSVFTSRFSFSSLSGVLTSAAFLTIASLGQMFVISTGRGNIDLSIPNILTLSAFVSTIIIHGNSAMIPVALTVALVIGIFVGFINAILVLRFRIPAMIATLASGYVLATGVLIANRSYNSYGHSWLLNWFVNTRFGGMPVIALCSLCLVGLSAYVLHRRPYGKVLMAVGQNIKAARLAGVKTNRVILVAFVISATCASVDGLLLSAHVGGAFLNMGHPYLLQSVGAVVVGGTLIYGGSSSAIGTFFGAILLVLIVTTMQIIGLSAGMQDVIQGIVIICVLAAAGRGLKRRSTGPANGTNRRKQGRLVNDPSVAK